MVSPVAQLVDRLALNVQTVVPPPDKMVVLAGMHAVVGSTTSIPLVLPVPEFTVSVAWPEQLVPVPHETVGRSVLTAPNSNAGASPPGVPVR